MDDNFLGNGAVLPHGLLGDNAGAEKGGFKKSYNNFALKIGVVKETYPVNDDRNRSKLTTEYDVVVIEQNEDRGATTILYRNCMSSEGLGSVADFFEKSLRKVKKKTRKGASLELKGQNGAVVLLLCLDGMADKGIIVGALTHPDRKTTLKDEGPHLEGEFNGVNVKVESDGSCTLTFKGATDNDGQPTDSSQGNTTVKIEKDGSFQVDHKTITHRLDKSGKASLTADDDISNTTKKNYLVSATEGVTIKAGKDFNLECQQLLAKASGSASLSCQSLEVTADSDIKLSGAQFTVEAESMAKIKSSIIVMDGITQLGGNGGQPVLLLTSQIFGIGNLGAPVLSMAISGFATQVFAQ
jgi:hypothetical protein